MNSPAEIVAAWPTTVITSRLPRAFTRKTQKPFSSLRKVTRSTSPAKTSVLLSAVVFKPDPSLLGARRVLFQQFNQIGRRRQRPGRHSIRRYRQSQYRRLGSPHNL